MTDESSRSIPVNANATPAEVWMVYMTAANAEEAQRIATVLVGERLAACVNVLGPIRSTYRWRGAIEHSEEVALIAKTARPRLEALIDRVRQIHSYETPCVVAWPITAGSEPFLRWVAGETGMNAPYT